MKMTKSKLYPAEVIVSADSFHYEFLRETDFFKPYSGILEKANGGRPITAYLSKKCSKCGEVKESNRFSNDKYCKDGLNSQCKLCNKKSALHWYKKNKKIQCKVCKISKLGSINYKTKSQTCNECIKKELKICNTCKTIKKNNDFYKQKSKKSGLTSNCKTCQKKYKSRSVVKDRTNELGRKRYQKPEVRKKSLKRGREYYKRPEVKLKKSQYCKNPIVKEKIKKRVQSPKYKAVGKLHRQIPYVKAKAKKRAQSPKYKAVGKLYKKKNKEKISKKAKIRNSKPEVRKRNNESTKLHRQIPYVKAKIKEYSKLPKVKRSRTIGKWIRNNRIKNKSLGIPNDERFTRKYFSDLIDAVNICPVCSKSINKNGGTYKNKDNSMALDRIVPKNGYTCENIKIICNRCNTIKLDVTDPDELRRVADYIERETKNTLLIVKGICKS